MDLPQLNDASQYLGRQLLSGDQAALNSQFGFDQNRSNYDFQSGGNVYRVVSNNNGTRSVQQVDTVANRMAQKAKSDRLAAIQPAIDSYNATKPEISKAYATERTRLEGSKQPLEERYKLLLDDIKGRETTATNRQTLTTNNELAKRGISSDSGIYQQEMTNVLNPITSEYGNIKKSATLDLSELLRGIDDSITGLVPKETADLRAITQAIADLQANTGNQSVTDYLTLAQQGFENNFQERQLQENIRQFGINEALKRLELSGSGGDLKDNYLTLSEGQTLWDLVSGKSVYTAPKTYKDTAAAAGSDWK